MRKAKSVRAPLAFGALPLVMLGSALAGASIWAGSRGVDSTIIPRAGPIELGPSRAPWGSTPSSSADPALSPAAAAAADASVTAQPPSSPLAPVPLASTTPIPPPLRAPTGPDLRAHPQSGTARTPAAAPRIIRHGPRTEKVVALTFDDGWNPDACAMAWDQPACSIVIEPRASRYAPRPVLADPIRPGGQPPRFRPRGAPTATARDNGIKVDLWLKDPTLVQGQWLLAHLRVTNMSGRTIPYNGRFEDLACPPLSIKADTSGLFDPGQTWTGVAATYKERFFHDGLLLRAPLGIPKRDRGNGCGDIGYRNRLEPGEVVDVPLAGMPAYPLRDQPLPPGRIAVSAGFVGARRADRVTVSTEVSLAGDPVGYPSPGELVDAALSTPGFIETLEGAPDPRDWANTHISWWKRLPYPEQPRFDAARHAPDGILEIMQFLGPASFVVGAVIDPWTGESFGSYGW